MPTEMPSCPKEKKNAVFPDGFHNENLENTLPQQTVISLNCFSCKIMSLLTQRSQSVSPQRSLPCHHI